MGKLGLSSAAALLDAAVNCPLPSENNEHLVAITNMQIIKSLIAVTMPGAIQVHVVHPHECTSLNGRVVQTIKGSLFHSASKRAVVVIKCMCSEVDFNRSFRKA